MRVLDVSRERAQWLLLALAALIVVAILPFATGLLGALILEVIFARGQRRLQRRMPARVAAAVLAVTAAVLVILPVALLAAMAFSRAPEAIDNLRHSSVLARLAALDMGGVSLGAELDRAWGTVLRWLSERGLRLFGSAAHAALNLMVAIFGLYYLLQSRGATWRWVRALLPFSQQDAEILRARFRSVTEATLLGIVATSLIQGTVVAVGFWLVGLPDALFWGTVTAFTSVLPLLGSAAVWVPGVVVLTMAERYNDALALLAIGAGIASSVDNLIRPMVYRRVSHVHPMTTIVGAIAGMTWLGLVGLLIGPLAITYFFELVRIYRAEYGMPDPDASGARSPGANAPPVPPLVATPGATRPPVAGHESTHVHPR
jgi:predicted PurR-regulated permease PerM